MAATMHAKMSKRKICKINLIQICEEILNPKVPMALRLSGILMGGVVIVYERKVKLLYDDVHRLLVELNEAWKVKHVDDPTILPKGKRQAKPEAVTLPNQQDTDLGEIEQLMDCSTTTFAAMNFQPSAYFSMNLDAVDELNENLREEDLTHHQHQANLADITMGDPFDPYQMETVAYTSFERFDMEGEEEIQMQFPSHDHIAVHLSPAPCPVLREETSQGVEMHDMQPEPRANEPEPEPRDESRDNRQPLQESQMMPKPKRRARKTASKILMDDELTVIPNTVYHEWLQDSSEIRGRSNKKHAKPGSSLKIRNLLELPNVVLSQDLLGNRISDSYFPVQLKELWTKSFLPSFDSPSVHNARTEPSSPRPHGSGQQFQDPQNFFDGGHSGFTSGSHASMEGQRAVPAMDGSFIPTEQIIGAGSVHNTTPNRLGNDLTTVLSQASLGSVHRSFTNNSDRNSTRSSKKRPHSPSHNNRSGLRTVVENPIMEPDMEHEPNFFINDELLEPNFKLARPSRNVLTPENVYTNMTPLLEETGRTQTQQRPVVDEEIENTTTTIRTHLKTYFEAPGAPQIESLDQLAEGMNRKEAAQLFYQTCVLATREFLKVQQTVAYGDILISRGAKM